MPIYQYCRLNLRAGGRTGADGAWRVSRDARGRRCSAWSSHGGRVGTLESQLRCRENCEFVMEYRPSRLKLDICSFYPCAAICETQPKLLLNRALRTRQSCAGLLDTKQAKENLATVPSLCKNYVTSQVCCSEESWNIFTWLLTSLWPQIPKCKFWVSQLHSEETLHSQTRARERREHRPAYGAKAMQGSGEAIGTERNIQKITDIL